MNITKEDQINLLLINANNLCKESLLNEFKNLHIAEYSYSSQEAVEELGLDKALVHDLVEDYVAQVIKSIVLFLEHIKVLKTAQKENQILDYKSLRELAHKNLGVAKNLRIKDGEKLLYELIKKDDLVYLALCVNLLEACAIKLKPICAYNTVTMIQIKKNICK